MLYLGWAEIDEVEYASRYAVFLASVLIVDNFYPIYNNAIDLQIIYYILINIYI